MDKKFAFTAFFTLLLMWGAVSQHTAASPSSSGQPSIPNVHGNEGSSVTPEIAAPPPTLNPLPPAPGWFKTSTPDPNRVYPGTYMVVAPGTVRPGLPYALSVDVQKAPEGEIIILIEIRNEKNQTIASHVESLQKIGTPQTVLIEQVPADALIAGEKYYIYVKGETLNSRKIFEDQQPIKCSLKSLSIFVQTDKAMYKPGSTVHYRVIVTNPDLSPYTSPINVYIDDPNQNRISNLQKLQLIKGVYSGELELSSDPPFGNWNIHVDTENGVKFDKEFNVAHYDPPKFEVIIKTRPFITFKDDLVVKIEAKYSNQSTVLGNVKVLAEFPTLKFWKNIKANLLSSQMDESAVQLIKECNEEAKDTNILIQTSNLNSTGKTTVTFSNSDFRFHNYDKCRPPYLEITTLLTDMNGLQLNSTAEVMVFYDPDGPDGNDFTNTEIFHTEYVESARSSANAFLQMSTENQGVTGVGEMFTFSVQSNESLPTISYLVFARGMVVLAQKTSLIKNTFKITRNMVPYSRLIVYAPKHNVILMDAVDFKCGPLNNFTLSMDKSFVGPNETVKFFVQAAPADSVITLMATQQSENMPMSDNFMLTTFEQEIEGYKSTEVVLMTDFFFLPKTTAVSDEPSSSLLYSSFFLPSSLDNETGVYEAKAPDTIDSFTVTALAVVNQQMAISSSVKLTIIPLIIRFNLPNIIRRNENLFLKVTVTNFLENEQNVTVTINHQSECGFVLKEENNTKIITVAGNGAEKHLSFEIIPTIEGELKLSINAASTCFSKDFEQFIRVESEDQGAFHWLYLLIVLLLFAIVAIGLYRRWRRHSEVVVDGEVAPAEIPFIGSGRDGVSFVVPVVGAEYDETDFGGRAPASHSSGTDKSETAVKKDKKDDGEGAPAEIPFIGSGRDEVSVVVPVVGAEYDETDFGGRAPASHSSGTDKSETAVKKDKKDDGEGAPAEIPFIGSGPDGVVLPVGHKIHVVGAGPGRAEVEETDFGERAPAVYYCSFI